MPLLDVCIIPILVYIMPILDVCIMQIIVCIMPTCNVCIMPVLVCIILILAVFIMLTLVCMMPAFAVLPCQFVFASYQNLHHANICLHYVNMFALCQYLMHYANTFCLHLFNTCLHHINTYCLHNANNNLFYVNTWCLHITYIMQIWLQSDYYFHYAIWAFPCSEPQMLMLIIIISLMWCELFIFIIFKYLVD